MSFCGDGGRTDIGLSSRSSEYANKFRGLDGSLLNLTTRPLNLSREVDEDPESFSGLCSGVDQNQNRVVLGRLGGSIDKVAGNFINFNWALDKDPSSPCDFINLNSAFSTVGAETTVVAVASAKTTGGVEQPC